MTREDIIAWAREAGMEQDGDNFFSPGHEEIDVHITDLERFAALVAAAEREACAKMADDHERQRCEAWAKVLTTGGEVPSASLSAVADAIRARGEIK